MAMTRAELLCHALSFALDSEAGGEQRQSALATSDL
jgi:hypothetical protein